MAESERNGFRLPRNVRPLSYDITMKPDLESFTFEGREIIELEVLETTREITLNATDLEIDSVSVSQWNGWMTKKHRASLLTDKQNERAILKLDTDLRPDKASIDMSFRGAIKDNLAGFYRAKYTLPDGTERYMATTQFEAIDARRAFPCFDEPEYKARFQLTLTVPKDKTAISNTPVEQESETADGKLVRFAKTPPMSTYLLAFTVGDLEHIEGCTKNGTLIRVFATPGKKEQCTYALEVGIKILEWQEEYFGIPYPLPKLDMAAIPDFAAGAMENWALITYRENALLFDPQNSPVSKKQSVAGYIAHEFAHMWFGDLVTMKWWDDLWLNESFATWLCSKTLNALFPEWKEWESFYSHVSSAGFAMDGLKSTHPVEVPINNPKEITQIFDDISYNKGASLIRMLGSYLDEDIFREGIRLYLNRHAYGNACTEDLWAALNEVSGQDQDIGAMMDTWTKQPGYPLVDAQTKNQKRFSYLPEASDQSWQIPITATSGTSWTKLNREQTGFYRVHYSPEMLAALYPAIESKELSTLDRIGLLDDTYALQKAGMIPATQFLELAEHYRNETEYAVWSNLCSGLAGVIGRLENEPYHPQLKRFAKSLLEKMYHDISWEASRDEDELRTLLRSLVIGNMGHYGHRAVVRTAKRKFFHFLMEKQSLDPNLRGVVCGIAAQYGTEAIHEAVLELYRSAATQEEKLRYLHALGCFQDGKLLEKTLCFAMSPEVRSQDTAGVITTVAGNPKGEGLAWQFLKANWQEFQKKYGEGIAFMLSHLVEGTISGFDTQEKKQEAEKFFASHPVPQATMALECALESIDINIAWMERNRDAVGEWLRNR